MYTKIYKVYGIPGHRQRESFSPSYMHNFSSLEDGTRVIIVLNSDMMHTNKYSVVIIVRDTLDACVSEFWEQISDGIFESSRVGVIEEIV